MIKVATHPRTRRNFDLPSQFSAYTPFIPTKATKSEEIQRRQREAPHSTVLRQQVTGLEASLAILSATKALDSEPASRSSIAKALLGASWHQYAEKASEAHRRTLKLPRIDLYDPESRPSAEYLRDRAVDMLVRATHLAVHLQVAHWMRAPKVVERTGFELGRHMGNTSLVLATVDIADHLALHPEYSPRTVQDAVMDTCGDMKVEALATAESLDVLPSIAQLGDRFSPLSVRIARRAPAEMVTAQHQIFDLREVA